MPWYADGFLLSRYAFNIRNRSAGWKIPGRRGENQVVPGRSGSIPLEYGPAEDGVFSAEMWAVGADYDGEMPTSMTAREQCRFNLDVLSRIFGSGRLIDIVRTEEGVDYGRLNMLRNPSFESADSKVAVRENVIANPGGEYSKGTNSARWNLFLNPSAELAARDTVWRRNLVRNPRFTAEGVAVVERRNRCTNPSFEQSMKTWKGNSNAKVTRVSSRFAPGGANEIQTLTLNGTGGTFTLSFGGSTTPSLPYNASAAAIQTALEGLPAFEVGDVLVGSSGKTRPITFTSAYAKIDTGSITVSSSTTGGTTTIATTRTGVAPGQWPVQRGQYSARVESLGSGNTDLTGGAGKIVAGQTYSFGVDFYNKATASLALSMIVQWRNKNGVFLSSSTFGGGSQASGAIGRITGTAVAPAGAVTATPRLRFAASASGQRVFWDGVMIEQATSPGSYFDGRTAEDDGLRHRWTDEAGLSASEEYRIRPKGWIGGTGISEVGLTDDESLRGPYSMKVWCKSTGSTGTLAQQEFSAAAKVGENQIVSGSIAVRPLADMTTTRTVGLSLMCWDSDGTALGGCLDAIGGATAAAQTIDLDLSGWTECPVEGVYTRPGTARVSLVLSKGGTMNTGEGLYVDTALVEKAAGVGLWFDGAMASDDTFAYAWTGDKHWSDSTQTGAKVLYWDALDGFQWQTTFQKAGTYGMVVVPQRAVASTDRIGVGQTITDEVRVGRWHTTSAFVNPNRTQNMKAQIGVVVGDTTTWYDGPTVSCTANAWTRLSLSLQAPDDCDGLTARFRSMVAPEQTDEINFDQMMFEPVGDLRRWFSGNSGDRYDWLGDEHESVSVFAPAKANGWTSFGDSYASLQRIEGGNGTAYAIRATAAQAGTLGVSAGADDVEEGRDWAFGVDVCCSATKTALVSIVWRDIDGEDISTSSTTLNLTADVWQRGVVVAEAPDGAVSGTPVVSVASAASGTMLDVDNAIFGWGANGSYADGDSGSGWEWVGVPEGSESRQMVPTADYWRSHDCVVLQDDAWAVDDLHSGEIVTSGPEPVIWPVLSDTESDSMYAADIGQRYSAGAVFRAADACRVIPAMVPLTQVGNRFYEIGDVILGAPVDFDPGDNATVYVTGVPSPKPSGLYPGMFPGGYPSEDLYPGTAYPGGTQPSTHFRLEFRIEAFGGGEPDDGTVVSVDRAILTTGFDVTYFDGDGKWHDWLGERNSSQSRIIGPARRAAVQVQSGIDMSSMAGGTRAEFTVEAKIPSVWWEDTVVTTKKYPLPRAGRVVALTAWSGMTAPIEDSQILLTGPFTDLKLTDLGSGSWLAIDGKFKSGEQVLVNCATWSVRRVKGPSILPSVSHGGHPRLLPLTTEPNRDHPRLRVDADAIGAGASIQITAPRKYQIA